MQNSFKTNNRATIPVVNLKSGQVGTFIITVNTRVDFHAGLLGSGYGSNLLQSLPKKYYLTNVTEGSV